MSDHPTYSMQTGVAIIEAVICELCGVVVHDRQAHDDFHERLAAAVDAPVEPIDP